MKQMTDYLHPYCEKVGISEDDLLGRRQDQRTSVARQVFWMSFVDTFGVRSLAEHFSRDRVTVIKGIRHARDLVDVRDGYAMKCFKSCADIVDV